MKSRPVPFPAVMVRAISTACMSQGNAFEALREEHRNARHQWKEQKRAEGCVDVWECGCVRPFLQALSRVCELMSSGKRP